MAQSNAPAINPTDLAAIMARGQARGFAASAPTRGTVLADGGSFLPSNFSADALRLPQAAPAATADTGAEVPTAAPDHAADPHPPAPAPPARDFDAELAAAHAKGHQAGVAEGLAKGRAETAAGREQAAANDLASARALFLRAAEVLMQPEASLSRELAQSVEGAVLRLAAHRVGMAIEAHPQVFADRVTRLADRVAHGLRAVRVALHPDDLALVAPHLDGFLVEGSILVPDPALLRGDIVVRTPSVTLADLLEGPVA